jgi:hypothetical protein
VAKRATNRPGKGVTRPKPKPIDEQIREAVDAWWAELPPEAAIVVLVSLPSPRRDEDWTILEPEQRGNPFACAQMARVYSDGGFVHPDDG